MSPRLKAGSRETYETLINKLLELVPERTMRESTQLSSGLSFSTLN